MLINPTICNWHNSDNPVSCNAWWACKPGSPRYLTLGVSLSLLTHSARHHNYYFFLSQSISSDYKAFMIKSIVSHSLKFSEWKENILPGSVWWTLSSLRILPNLWVSVVLITQSYPTLCNPTDCSLQGSSVHGILQGRILEGVAFPSPGDLPYPGIEPGSPTLQADPLLSKPPGKPYESLMVINQLNVMRYPASPLTAIFPTEKLTSLHKLKTLPCSLQHCL